MRRSRWVVVLLLMVAAGGASAAVLLSIHRAGNPGRLTQSQWRSLTERIALRVATRRRVTAVPAAPASPPETAALPATPWRLWAAHLDEALRGRQDAEYEADRVKTVMELQRYRQTESIAIPPASDGPATATLINLNPVVNAWYVLELGWSDNRTERYHLVNMTPASQELHLAPAAPGGLLLVTPRGELGCDLWSGDAEPSIADAASSRAPYRLLCDGRVALRIATPGNRTTLEWATDFLRDNVWGGEKITVLVRQALFQDAFLATSDVRGEAVADGGATAATPPGWPLPAQLADAAAGTTIVPVDLGITLAADGDDRVRPGRWYEARDVPGVYVSVVAPDLLAPEVLASYASIAGRLDEVERSALAYLVAFDLARFDVGFSLGTDHPRVGWSDRVPESVRDPSLPGPDGIGDVAPLVRTGIVPPAAADRIAATFTGGFKRAHGAFRTSPMASVNHGSHYGFVESGVVLSKLQPGLATLYVTVEGHLGMKTWAAGDDAGLSRIAFARQNGVPIVEPDPATGRPRPGELVARWGLGNWSGSQDERFRTLRAGACLQDTEGARYLVYGYFSSATPSAMARVFQAYECGYGMLLDINALEHTYLALYDLRGSTLAVEHLIRGMEVLDKTVRGSVLPRFLGFADNRDFFYLVRKAAENVVETPASAPAPAAGSMLPADEGSREPEGRGR